MSTDRLEELGVPRRAFLKKAAGAALIAPAIVSFGMDVIAEGPNATALPGQSHPNQFFPNQALTPGHGLWDILDTLLLAVEQSQHGGLTPPLTIHNAEKFASMAMQAAILAASGDFPGSSNAWGAFISKVQRSARKLPLEVADKLVKEGQRAQQEIP
jgi:hypothetical protein